VIPLTPAEAGTNRLALFGRYAVQLVPVLAASGAVHSSIACTARDNGTSSIVAHAAAGCATGALAFGLKSVSINGAMGGCLLLGAIGAAGQVHKHSRNLPSAPGRVEEAPEKSGVDGVLRV
jgi:hypothetical protein